MDSCASDRADMPRERYTVQVTPVLTYSATDITALQRIADHLRCAIAYVNGSFVFVEQAQGEKP